MVVCRSLGEITVFYGSCVCNFRFPSLPPSLLLMLSGGAVVGALVCEFGTMVVVLVVVGEVVLPLGAIIAVSLSLVVTAGTVTGINIKSPSPSHKHTHKHKHTHNHYHTLPYH